MPNPCDADLPARIARAMACVARWSERRLAEGVLDPHNYGRAVDALLKGAAASGTPAPEAVVEGLRAVLLELTDNPLGFPQVDGQTNPHDLREMVQSFTELAAVRDDRAARERLGTLLDTWIRLTNPDGTWRVDLIAAEPSLKHPGFTDERDGIESPPPRSRARTVMALTHLFRLTGDQRALELAGRFVRLARTTSFTEDGRLTAQAGAHTHSITGTVQGLADYGLLIGDLDTVEHARRIFDVGLAPTCSSFGWSIENLGNERVPGRGEINNTGDMIQTAIILGLAGRPEYFGVAERMIRSHVLPSQWLTGQEMLSPEDAPDYAVTEFPPEADGGWGFPSPSDRHVPDPLGVATSVLDVVQGGIQCLWAALRHGSTRHGSDTRLNLLFSTDRAAARTSSRLPAAGDVTVTMPAAGSLWVRKPDWLPWRELTLGLDGETGAGLGLRRIEPWAVTDPLPAGTQVQVRFTPVRRSEAEWVYWQRHDMVFEGDTLVEMSPRGRYSPMFADLASEGVAPG